MKRIMPALAAALAAAVLPAAQPGTATLTVSGYKDSTTLTDFPVLVRVPSTISLLCGPDGSTMRFYAADGVTELAHQIDTWNYGSESCVWVKLPALAAGTTFIMSYGGAYGPRTTAEADVWTSYVGVWHLNETANEITTVADATALGLSGTTVASSLPVADGKVGGARFVTSDETISSNPYDSGITVDMTGDTDKLAAVNGLVPEFTASFWVRPRRNTPRWCYLLSRRGADKGAGWGLQLANDNNWKQFRVYGGEETDTDVKPNVFTTSASLSKEKWTKVDAVWFENKTFHLYMDGNKVGEGTLVNQAANGDRTKFSIGGSLAQDTGNSGCGVKGDMDEVRLRKGAPSPEWIKAEYDSVNNPAFVTFDSVPAFNCYVTPAGTPGNAPAAPYDSWAKAANDFETLSAAIVVEDVPVVVHVAPGVYDVPAPITLAHPRMTLVSDDGTGATARWTTVLDGGYPARTNRIVNVTAADVTIRGLTFRNAMVAGENDGGAIYSSAAGTHTSVFDCSFTNCIARHGGAIRFNAAKVWLEGCDFNDCHAWTTTTSYETRDGGGVYVNTATGSVVTNCSFTGCTAYRGGAIKTPSPNSTTDFSDRADYTIISGCTFTRNAPVKQNDKGNPVGGGVCGKAWVENCRFDANHTTNKSGFNPAIGFDHASVITNCVFENHSSAERGIVGPRGGTTLEARVVDCVFRGNTCQNMLGGQSIIAVDRCVFTNNAVTGPFFWSGSKHVMRNSLYACNLRPLRPSSARFENCTIVSNTCGIYIMEKESPVLVNCYIGGNTNPPTRFDNYRGNANFGYFETGWDKATSSFVFDFHATNCVIEGAHILEQRDTRKTFDLFDYEPSGTCEAITDLVAAKGAGFVDAAHGDWRLQRKSPLRDAGLLLPWMADGSTDLDGNPRLTDRFGKPFAPDALPDIGCYECQERTPYSTTILLQ